jgi:hypothetical protein
MLSVQLPLLDLSDLSDLESCESFMQVTPFDPLNLPESDDDEPCTPVKSVKTPLEFTPSTVRVLRIQSDPLPGSGRARPIVLQMLTVTE